MNKKLSISVRFTSTSPAHTWFKLYANMIPQLQEHEQGTRASLGEAICLRNEEIKPFMRRLKPDLYTLSDKVDKDEVCKNIGMDLEYLQKDSEYVPDYLVIKQITRGV